MTLIPIYGKTIVVKAWLINYLISYPIGLVIPKSYICGWQCMKILRHILKKCFNYFNIVITFFAAWLIYIHHLLSIHILGCWIQYHLRNFHQFYNFYFGLVFSTYNYQQFGIWFQYWVVLLAGWTEISTPQKMWWRFWWESFQLKASQG